MIDKALQKEKRHERAKQRAIQEATFALVRDSEGVGTEDRLRRHKLDAEKKYRMNNCSAPFKKHEIVIPPVNHYPRSKLDQAGVPAVVKKLVDYKLGRNYRSRSEKVSSPEEMIEKTRREQGCQEEVEENHGRNGYKAIESEVKRLVHQAKQGRYEHTSYQPNAYDTPPHYGFKIGYGRIEKGQDILRHSGEKRSSSSRSVHQHKSRKVAESSRRGMTRNDDYASDEGEFPNVDFTNLLINKIHTWN